LAPCQLFRSVPLRSMATGRVIYAPAQAIRVRVEAARPARLVAARTALATVKERLRWIAIAADETGACHMLRKRWRFEAKAWLAFACVQWGSRRLKAGWMPRGNRTVATSTGMLRRCLCLGRFGSWSSADGFLAPRQFSCPSISVRCISITVGAAIADADARRLGVDRRW